MTPRAWLQFVALALLEAGATITAVLLLAR